MVLPETAYPPQLLRAVAERHGRVVLVLGAGCSLESPTGLKLARAYSEDVHRQLVLDGVLQPGDCAEPSDLSALSSAVFDRHGSQSAVVERLPLNQFRIAAPNSGYLIAAALLIEGAVSAVLTLNFDLAMTNALSALGATDVTIVPGPGYAAELGGKTLVYLHRNVDEANHDAWILRAEALEQQWQNRWEEVVTRRIMASPLVIFAGLGSPAAVLTVTLTRIREAIDDGQQHVFVVDPFSATSFQEVLNLPPEVHIQAGWGEFMLRLAQRLTAEMGEALQHACRDLCESHGWIDELARVPELVDRLHAVGLLGLGSIRATWLLADQSYVRDDERRGLVADLLLGVGLAEGATGTHARFLDDGVVQLYRDRQMAAELLPISGGGILRWAALEPRVLRALEEMEARHRLDFALVSGTAGPVGGAIAPPEDLVMGDVEGDIVGGYSRPEIVVVDALRAGEIDLRRLVQ